MSEDEVFVTVVAFVVGPVLWPIRLARWLQLRRSANAVRTVAAALTICAAILLGVLTKLAASDVVDAPVYIFMYFVLGLAWIRASESGFALAGLSISDDAVERGNGAALTAAVGALIGVTLCYAGANIGNGPGWWVVVFSAALATAALFACWIVLGSLTGVNDAVTIDRDPAAGIRLGAFLVACGLVLGRAVAGDWESAARTVRDATVALPPLTLSGLIAAAFERVARPKA